jgi:hypothetical protein
MRTVRNITVAVGPELYRQTCRIAADYDTTVADRVRCPARSSEGHALSQPSKLPVSPRKKAKSPCMPVKASNIHHFSYLQQNGRRPYRISISVSSRLKPSFKMPYFHFAQNAF